MFTLVSILTEVCNYFRITESTEHIVFYECVMYNQPTVHGGLFLKLKCTYKYPFYSFNVTFSLLFNGNAKFKVFSFKMYLHFHVNQVSLLTKNKGLTNQTEIQAYSCIAGEARC